MKLLAACAFGLESIVKRELSDLQIDSHIIQPGKIQFDGDWQTVCKTNLWLRTADRILIEVARFSAADFDQLFETTKSIEWSEWLHQDSAFPVRGRSKGSQLTSVPAVQRSVKRAVVESLQSAYSSELPETGPQHQIEIALLNDEATLTIDTTGPSLHKRGYRTLVGGAPIKETLAAALIQLSVWNASRPLIDPFCGTGTIPIEAAMNAMKIAPGIDREFSFMSWHDFPQQTYKDVWSEAHAEEQRDLDLQIMGTDIDSESIKLARFHAEKAGVSSKIHFQTKPFHELRSKRDYGCIITNPPYGERLFGKEKRDLFALYESIPQTLQRLPTWSHFIFTSFRGFERTIQKKATRRRKLFNGRIECNYYQFLGPKPPSMSKSESKLESKSETDIAQDVSACDTAPDESVQWPDKKTTSVESTANSTETQSTKSHVAVFGGLQAKDHEQAELFVTRLKKRIKHLRRWPNRGISCFRVYERDIPELPFVVDRYEVDMANGKELFVHATEYERPHERDLARHASWLELMKKSIAAAFDIPIQRTVMKSRVRLHDKRQYERIERTEKQVKVHEGGHQFWINLSDYVDTGLFLDHRNTREMIQKESEGKRFLNLFAYTGSFSVYSAAGNARSTTTVDVSRKYLEWCQRNFAANEITSSFSEGKNRLVESDSIEYLESLPKNSLFDLAMVDPPTFSNSKDRSSDWDVQEDHERLLHELHSRMAPHGVVYFSTNFRRFNFSTEAISWHYDIREISKQTVPEDFRNKRIHRCWRLVKKKT